MGRCQKALSVPTKGWTTTAARTYAGAERSGTALDPRAAAQGGQGSAHVAPPLIPSRHLAQDPLTCPRQPSCCGWLKWYRKHWASCHRKESHKRLRDLLASGRRPRCKYMFFQITSDGVGNRLLGLLSSFLYSLLTGRVFLLVPGPNCPSNLLCEPFPSGPSWLYNRFLLYKFKDAIVNVTYSDCFFLQQEAPPLLQWWVYHADTDLSKYFCEDYHAWAEGVSALVGFSNQYYVPALYAIPKLKHMLSSLFRPGQSIYGTLAPLILSPSNTVWQLATSFVLSQSPSLPKEQQLEQQQRRHVVGLQYRGTFLKGDKAVPLAAQCIAEWVYGNATSSSSSSSGGLPCEGGSVCGSGTGPPFLGVNIASLDEGVAISLSAELTLQGHPLAEVGRMTHDTEQKFSSPVHDQQAFAEILCLSLASDSLLVTAGSTFGYVAVSLSASAASLLLPGCPAADADPCFQLGRRDIKCCNLSETFKAENLRFLRRCADWPGVMVHENATEML